MDKDKRQLEFGLNNTKLQPLPPNTARTRDLQTLGGITLLAALIYALVLLCLMSAGCGSPDDQARCAPEGTWTLSGYQARELSFGTCGVQSINIEFTLHDGTWYDTDGNVIATNINETSCSMFFSQLDTSHTIRLSVLLYFDGSEASGQATFEHVSGDCRIEYNLIARRQP